MWPFEEAVEAACAAEEIPGAVLLASDRQGTFTYARAFGKRSVRAGADQSALRPDDVTWIASCTKVVTAIAVLQCVERRRLPGLDTPIYDVLPELRGRAVIRGFDGDGAPVLTPHESPITLRRLLDHSSGLAYDETHPKLLAWHRARGTRPRRDDGDTVARRFDYPLVFEPGASWCYGAGVDWAGLAVERAAAAGGEEVVDLQGYCERHIFAPVGARDVVYSNHLALRRPDMVAGGRRVDMSKRDPATPGRVKRSNARLQYPEGERGACLGGLGLFASPVDFLKILRGLLLEDGTLLSRRALDEEFFRPGLGPEARRALGRTLAVGEEARVGMGNLPAAGGKDWALGGIVNEEDVPGGRRAGSMTWTGLPNLAWFVDRKAGLCGFYAGQLLPPGDAKVGELCEKFEKGIYEVYSNTTSKL
ncbi:beta-lactamase/transpeptidase-like protein [Xylariaceae sp. FL0804]|nr:beta-lactamase/transpeptidase-like protein [Xylariaceae sp. FL0804]